MADKQKLVSTRQHLAPDVRAKIVELINARLADTLDLYSQIKHAHWNLKGTQFIGLHELFDTLAEGVEADADEIAERATALGGFVRGSVKMVAAKTTLDDFPKDTVECLEVVAVLADRYAACSKATYAAIVTTEEHGDKVTSDMFTGIAAKLDKALWFLEAHLQK